MKDLLRIKISSCVIEFVYMVDYPALNVRARHHRYYRATPRRIMAVLRAAKCAAIIRP